MTTFDEAVEIAARAICDHEGLDPDHIEPPSDSPRWRWAAGMARAALLAVGERFALVPRACTEEMIQALRQMWNSANEAGEAFDTSDACAINEAIAAGDILPKREG